MNQIDGGNFFLEILKNVDVFVTDKYTGLELAERYAKELGLKEQTANLSLIAESISQFPKYNSLRPQRVCVITDFINPVTFAVSNHTKNNNKNNNHTYYDRVKFDEVDSSPYKLRSMVKM